MIQMRRSDERGHARHGWLESRHSFSFAEYRDPAHMGVSCLRVINEDWIAPGGGFPTHSHRDMEIITYVLEGALEHRDSMGNRALIRPGEVQRMSAGRGVSHSEYNASESEPLHLLQIWILPDVTGIDPGYEQIRMPECEQPGCLRLIGAPDGRDGSVTLRQDAFVYAVRLDGGAALEHRPAPGRTLYLQVARGSLEVNGHAATAGDGVTVTDERALGLSQGNRAEALLFDLP